MKFIIHIFIFSGLGKVFNFNPAFRAEYNSTKRHLSEFWMIEAEEAFLCGNEGEEHLVNRIEELVCYVLKDVLDKMEEDVHYHWKLNEKNKVSFKFYLHTFVYQDSKYFI